MFSGFKTIKNLRTGDRRMESIDRIFSVEVAGLPDSISDTEIRMTLANAVARLVRESSQPGAVFSVGTSGGTLKKE